MALVTNSYATGLLDREMRAREFSLLGRLLSAIPVWRLRPHEERGRIDRLCELIFEALTELKGAPSQAPPNIETSK